MKKIITLIGACGVAMAINCQAQANTIVQSIPFSWTKNQSTSLNYTLFDSNNVYATQLTNVQVEINGSDFSSIKLVNIDTVPEAYTGATGFFNVTATGAPGSTTYLTQQLPINSYSGTAPVGVTVITDPLTFEDWISSVPVGDWFGNFEANGGGAGPSPMVFTIDNGTFSGATDGDVFFSGLANMSGNLIITYTYREVPEPGTTGLLVSAGIMTLVGARRRRALGR